MSHKYDELQRLLSDQLIVLARTLREAESLGVTNTVGKLKGMLVASNKMLDTVNTRIEAAHVDSLMDLPAQREFIGAQINPPPTQPRPPAPRPPPGPPSVTTLGYVRPAAHPPAPPPAPDARGGRRFSVFTVRDGKVAGELKPYDAPPLPVADPPAPPPAAADDSPSFDGGGGSFDGGGASD